MIKKQDLRRSGLDFIHWLLRASTGGTEDAEIAGYTPKSKPEDRATAVAIFIALKLTAV